VCTGAEPLFSLDYLAVGKVLPERVASIVFHPPKRPRDPAWRRATISVNQGDTVRFPIMTLSIGVVTNVQSSLADAKQVSNRAAEMKKYAKGIVGSVYRVDRRAADGSAEPAAAGVPSAKPAAADPGAGAGGSAR